MRYFPTAVRIVEEMHVVMKNWSKNEPIFIYQFGKVGSSTLYHSLKESGLQNPIYHTHYLTAEGVEGAVEFHSQSGDPVLPHHLILSRVLVKRLERENDLKFKVITLVRDPVERAISSAFENIYRTSGNCVAGRTIDLKAMADNLTARLASNTGPIEWLEHWLNTEMRAVTGIDLLEAPFSIDKGWSINSNEHVSVLTIQVERLSDVFSEALSEFLNTPSSSIKLCNTNVGQEKWYAEDYKKFKAAFVLPADIAAKAYSSRYVQKFYPDKINRY